MALNVLTLMKTGNVLYRNNEALSRNYCFRGKAISITYSECVPVALDIQRATRMRCITLSFIAYLARLYFFYIIS